MLLLLQIHAVPRELEGKMDVDTFAAAFDWSLLSLGGIPIAETLNLPLCCKLPSAATMQFSAQNRSKATEI